MNGFFKLDDPKVDNLNGYPLNPAWWSRHCEYPWALQFAEPGQTVSDMGCGWMPRPFKDALAGLCEKVYAVDANPRVIELSGYPNLEYVVADITQLIEAIPPASLDRLFCISVLEDLHNLVPEALWQFAHLIKDDGLIILTFDVPYDLDKETRPYPGVNLGQFMIATWNVGLQMVGEISFDKTDALYHPDYNLCVFHCVLRKT